MKEVLPPGQKNTTILSVAINFRRLSRPAFLGLWVMLLLPAACFAAEPPVFTLQKEGVGFDVPLPNYRIEVYADGTVHYRGDKDVKVVGDRYAKITSKQLQQLIAVFKSYDLEEFRQMEAATAEHRGPDDVNRPLLRFEYMNEAIEVRAIDLYDRILVDLSGMANLKRWLCFPKKHPSYEYCPLNAKLLYTPVLQ